MMSNRAYGMSSGRASGRSARCGSTLTHRQLRHTGRHVEVHDRPPPHERGDEHPRIGVHHHRVPHRGQHRDVVVAVGVGPALPEVDGVLHRPLGDGPQLARAPHELAVEGAVVHAVLHAVAGGDDVVEARARRRAASRGRRAWWWRARAAGPPSCARRGSAGRRAAAPPASASAASSPASCTCSRTQPCANRTARRVTSMLGRFSPNRS